MVTKKYTLAQEVLKKINYILPIAIFALSLWVLDRQLHSLQLNEILDRFSDISLSSVLIASVFTFLSYIALISYDFLAMRYIGQSVSYKEILRSSFTSTSISYSIGFNPLTGGSLRYRLYSAYGLTVLQIGKIITFCSITFWLGICFVGGSLLSFYPIDLPGSLSFYEILLKALGVCLLLVLAVYLFLCLQHKTFRVKGDEVQFPDIRTALVQILISSLDSVFAGSALYFLLFSNGEVSFPYLIAMFLVAQIIAYMTTIPGGLGGFEAIMLFALAPLLALENIIVGLVMFRIVYYLTPFLVGLVILSYSEFNARKEILINLHKRTYLTFSAFTPQVFAVLIFFAGILLLFSEALPAQIEGILLIADIVPLSLIESSSLLSSMIGVLLLILANGLWKRVDGAYLLSVVILFLGSIFSILKGLNYIESGILFAIFLLLLPQRKHFYRKSSLLNQSFSRDNIIAIAVVVLSFIWLGLFAHEHVEYSQELLWQFGTNMHVSRFLRSVVGISVVLAIFGIMRLLGGSSKDLRLPDEGEMDKTKEIIRTSTDTNGNLVLLEDKYVLFNEERTTFLMYGISGKSWVCMGDPIGNSKNVKELIWDFHEMANLHQGWTVFYEVSEKYIPYYLDIGLTLIKIGEEARVQLSEFSLEGSAGKDFRYSVKRMEKDGYHFEIMQPEDIPAHIEELKSISDAWLETKSTKEKSFSMGSFKTEYLTNFPLAIIKKGDQIAAFANIWVAANKEEMAIDLMRYDPAISNTAMEYLFTKLMLWGKENGFRCFSLGMSPLSGLENRTLAPLWNKIGSTIFTHGEYFYNFKGLRAYKEKFNPIWEPRYIALPKGIKQMFVLKDIALLISGGTKEIFMK
ncbi:MAG: bifunctional lysylphosphatidylglycerol flippase/synthetase MprF [Methanomethylovorans sp.]|nr:bifunctional lysylphosphatidylglycerol flippase/synthetase MprF [Methanomethylovorans sp.]